jgi:hypothetical protein
MSNENKLNVYQRIHLVMNGIETIKKRGRNDFHKYDYATEADFVHALRPLLKEAGLVIIPKVGEVKTTEPDEKGNVIATAHVDFMIVNIDHPSDVVVVSVVGQGQDKGDKAVYKLMTGAKKYFAALTFMVATGDDPENDNGEARRQLAPKKSKPAVASNQDDF